MKTHEISGKTYHFHEKHGKWVVDRCGAEVNATGGSWFEAQQFDTEEQCVASLDKRPKPITDHNCYEHIEFRTSFQIAHCEICKKRLTKA